MSKEQGPMSGFRDLLADQMIPRQEVLETVRGVYESYGFVPLKTPALERLETMAGKYGDEGEKLMYKFIDNGGRDVAMRYDQTVPLARVVAQYGSQLPTIYKRYAIGEVWRGESPQAGRYREFTQFDADTVGTGSYLADTEIIAMMADSMEALGMNALIRVNDRRVLDALAANCNIDEERDFRALIGSIDKTDKIGAAKVVEEIEEQFDKNAAGIVHKYLTISGSTEKKLNSVSELLGESAETSTDALRMILGSLTVAGYRDDQIVYDPTIARGLDYYTSTVYETTLTDLPTIGSVCSGGRFDNLIEAMGGPSKPAVGTSIGVDRLMESMRLLELLPTSQTKTEIFVLNMGQDGVENQRFALTQLLRKCGVATEIYLDEKKIDKQFKNITRLGVDKVIFYGTNELANGYVKLKDLKTGEESEITLGDDTADEICRITRKIK